MMDRAEDSDLLRVGAEKFGLSLGEEEIKKFLTYRSLLQLWGSKMNLSTRLRDRDIIVYHFLDSLSGAKWLLERPAAAVADIGSGAGFPSLPLKISLPELRILLVERSSKKVSFCKEVIRATHLKNCRAIWGRGEDVGRAQEHRGSFDWVTSRALNRAAAVVKLALPFLAPGGSVLLYKSELPKEELLDLDRLCETTGLSWETRPIEVPHLDAVRTHLVVRRR